VVQEYKSQLGVSQGQGPETQVRGCIGDTAEHKLNTLNHLVDECLANAVFVVLVKSVLSIEDIFPVLIVLFIVLFKSACRI